MYKEWEIICNDIVNNKLVDWKTNKKTTYMLEHLGKSFADIYLENLIINGFDTGLIRLLSSMNDSIGCPYKENFLFNINASPSNIRYISQSVDIINHLKSKNLDLNNISIVEVGAGYGGLCLILNMLCLTMNITIKNYYIYDLKSTQNLQKYFLNNFPFITNVVWKNSETFGEDLNTNENFFLISNYCISEIQDEYRIKYLNNLLPKIKGAYMAWNWGSKNELPVNRVEKKEIPDTSNGGNNTIILI